MAERSERKANKLKVPGSIPVGFGSWQVTQRVAWSLYKREVLDAEKKLTRFCESNIHTLINQNLYISQTYINFSQRL